MIRACIALMVTGVFSLYASQAKSQLPDAPGADTSYYKSYTHLLTSRIYLSQKYTTFSLVGRDSIKDLRYRPNTTRNLGIGVTYGWLTLNLALGLPFLNNGEDPKGKTRYLDLQSHIYARKYSIDLLGEFYKSYYLHPKGKAAGNGDDYYIRPDLRVTHLGIAGYRVFNWKRFSFRAAMLQNEWQQKSAGSPLAGMEIYYGITKADSAFVPADLQEDYGQQGITSVRYVAFGPGAGYAYTLVIGRHFFVTGSATASLLLDWHKEKAAANTPVTKISARPGFSYRAAVGYNSSRWSVSALWVNNGLSTRGASGKYHVNTGNIRLTTAYRFKPGPGLKKSLKLFTII